MPPASGNAAPSSAMTNAPAKARTAPAIHTSNTTASDGICCAIKLGTRKIPEPTIVPAAIATPSRRRISLARRWGVAAGANDELIVTAALYDLALTAGAKSRSDSKGRNSHPEQDLGNPERT